MDFKAENVIIENEFELIVKEQEIINEVHLAKIEYLDFLLDQLLIECFETKNASNDDLQINNITKIRCSKKSVFLYLLINFYITIVLLTFIFFFIIDPYKLVNN